jgi:hypothetical protein
MIIAMDDSFIVLFKTIPSHLDLAPDRTFEYSSLIEGLDIIGFCRLLPSGSIIIAS